MTNNSSTKNTFLHKIQMLEFIEESDRERERERQQARKRESSGFQCILNSFTVNFYIRRIVNFNPGFLLI